MKYIPIHKRLKSFSDGIERHFPQGISPKLKRYIAINFVWEKIFHNTRFTDYMQYEYHRYSSHIRREFISEQRRLIIDDAFNTESGDAIFNDKARFNELFAEYINRDWLNCSAATVEDFIAFIEKHPVFFGKPEGGSLGRGAGIFNISKSEDPEILFKQLERDGMLIEECISQHAELEEFNSSSVNTLRVVTVLRPNNEVSIVSADLRLGRKGRTSDNFHNQGIASLIDIESGVVYTTGIDKSSNRFLFHPDSGKQIVGFSIPEWEKVKKTVVNAAKVVPEVHYVGWDIAIGQDGSIYIVEGNCCADPDVTQMPDGIGKWPLYIPLIEEANLAKLKGWNYDKG